MCRQNKKKVYDVNVSFNKQYEIIADDVQEAEHRAYQLARDDKNEHGFDADIDIWEISESDSREVDY